MKINLNRRLDSIFGFEKWLVNSSIRDMIVEQINISYIEEIVTFLWNEGDMVTALLIRKGGKTTVLRIKGNIHDWGDIDLGVREARDLDVPPFFGYEFVVGVLRGRGIL